MENDEIIGAYIEYLAKKTHANILLEDKVKKLQKENEDLKIKLEEYKKDNNQMEEDNIK
ncbi:hypothetical protein [Anaerococcus nagyae]|uniref:hypothetical protein n=1 Tax=Anaerococcus nagyae TaxID=1755241 RepID=UPI0032467941